MARDKIRTPAAEPQAAQPEGATRISLDGFIEDKVGRKTLAGPSFRSWAQAKGHGMSKKSAGEWATLLDKFLKEEVKS